METGHDIPVVFKTSKCLPRKVCTLPGRDINWVMPYLFTSHNLSYMVDLWVIIAIIFYTFVRLFLLVVPNSEIINSGKWLKAMLLNL